MKHIHLISGLTAALLIAGCSTTTIEKVGLSYDHQETPIESIDSQHDIRYNQLMTARLGNQLFNKKMQYTTPGRMVLRDGASALSVHRTLAEDHVVTLTSVYSGTARLNGQKYNACHLFAIDDNTTDLKNERSYACIDDGGRLHHRRFTLSSAGTFITAPKTIADVRDRISSPQQRFPLEVADVKHAAFEEFVRFSHVVDGEAFFIVQTDNRNDGEDETEFSVPVGETTTVTWLDESIELTPTIHDTIKYRVLQP
jgi:hypothetical protein